MATRTNRRDLASAVLEYKQTTNNQHATCAISINTPCATDNKHATCAAS